MKRSSLFPGAAASLLLAVSLSATAAPGYRLVPIIEDDAANVIVTDLNNRGEVVGARAAEGVLRAFRWRDGELTDLHDLVAPGGSIFTEAVGLNDFSTIVGFRAVPAFEGFILRGTQVAPLQVVPGESNVFPSDINDRGQIIADSFGGAQSGSFFIEHGQAELLGGLPGGSGTLQAIDLNDRGVVVGNAQSASGNRAVLWHAGEITDLGVVPGADSSFGADVNNRDQAVGFVSLAGSSAAFLWRDGVMTLLPRLTPSVRASTAENINDWGAIVGSSITVAPEFRSSATLWLAGRALDLDSLVSADDPLKPFVHLESASQINDRGDIVASGVDSREPTRRLRYFLTLFGR